MPHHRRDNSMIARQMAGYSLPAPTTGSLVNNSLKTRAESHMKLSKTVRENIGERFGKSNVLYTCKALRNNTKYRCFSKKLPSKQVSGHETLVLGEKVDKTQPDLCGKTALFPLILDRGEKGFSFFWGLDSKVCEPWK